MIVTYWGVRGSLPVPGPSTVRYGGNTSCVAVEVAGRLLVLDAGTGIRALGAALEGRQKEVAVLLSHRHADHVQGLPFFEPLFEPGREIHLIDFPGAGEPWSLMDVFDGTQTPVRPAQLDRSVRRSPVDARALLTAWGLTLRTLRLHHPGGSFGYRIEQDGRAFVHMTDNELDEGDEGEAYFGECVRFCRGAAVLSHDAQYLRGEMPARRGRGHSSVERVCELAESARVRRLVLFHHDPDRSDAELASVEARARERLRGAGIECDAAYEGLRIEL